MMLARDALDLLIAELGLLALGTSPDGETEHLFDRPFRFTVTEVDAFTLALFAPLDLPAELMVDVPPERLFRRLLEANLQGLETGAGSMCRTASGALGYRDVIDLRDMSRDQFQLRFVDFSLYFDFWRSDGIRILQQDLGRDDPPVEGMLRL